MTFFKAEDFYDAKAADIANQKLQRGAMVVYGNVDPVVLTSWMSSFEGMYLGPYTHKALLVCIEPLEKPKCEHKVYFDGGKYSSSCLHCGANMKPTGWEVVDEQR